jgi:hypothetical protein
MSDRVLANSGLPCGLLVARGCDRSKAIDVGASLEGVTGYFTQAKR